MGAVNVMDIAARRDQRAADDGLAGRALCRAWTGDVDAWLAGLLDEALARGTVGAGGRVALVAVGGYGRRELSLQSDLDLMLLHDLGRDRSGLSALADAIWYPIWDAKLKLGHTVRTVDEALSLASDDLDTATSLLDSRFLAGDAGLAAGLADAARGLWQKRARRYLGVMAERVRERHARAGETAFLLEPDLKEGRGGLRDVHALQWAQAAQSIMWEGDPDRLDAAYDVLLAARVELHRRTGRPGDKLLIQEQDAVAAAARDTRVHRGSLVRLAAATPELAEPWPPAVREALVELLLTGAPSIGLLEALDQCGLWERYVPEWPLVRAKPQRNAYHRFTVDRHLWEATAEAAAVAGRVARPDLLVLGALFHDIGKGLPGDHTQNGIDMLERIGPRLGLPDHDAGVLIALCRHHLLLPDVATRRDLGDPATIEAVAEAVGTSEVLELLGALTEADSLATGPAAWSAWKADLVRDLVVRTDHVLGGGRAHDVAEPFPTTAQKALLAEGRQVITYDGSALTVVCADRHGLFNRVAGVLALHGLDVLDAMATTEGRTALEVFRVESSLGPVFSWPSVVEDLERALDGQLALRARLAERARRYGRTKALTAERIDAEVRFDLTASADATVAEVHASDAVGALYRITRAFADLDLDIVSAKVQTLGPVVVDSFYLRDHAGRKITDPLVLSEIERAVLHALGDG